MSLLLLLLLWLQCIDLTQCPSCSDTKNVVGVKTYLLRVKRIHRARNRPTRETKCERMEHAIVYINEYYPCFCSFHLYPLYSVML